MAISQEGIVTGPLRPGLRCSASRVDAKKGLDSRPRVWRSSVAQACVVDLSPGTAQSPGERHHAFCQGWRFFELRAFLRSGRHEAQEMLQHRAEQQLRRMAEAVHFEELRALLQESASFRTALLGAFVSPAWLAVCPDTNPVMHHCPRCGLHRAGFAHMTYHCPGLPTRPVVPHNPWLFRLGWPLKALTKEVEPG